MYIRRSQRARLQITSIELSDSNLEQQTTESSPSTNLLDNQILQNSDSPVNSNGDLNTALDNQSMKSDSSNSDDDIPLSPFTSPSMPVLDNSLSSFAFKMEL